MVVGYAWATEVEGALDFADALGSAAFEEVPVDFPGFASQSVLDVGFLFSVQGL